MDTWMEIPGGVKIPKYENLTLELPCHDILVVLWTTQRKYHQEKHLIFSLLDSYIFLLRRELFTLPVYRPHMGNNFKNVCN